MTRRICAKLITNVSIDHTIAGHGYVIHRDALRNTYRSSDKSTGVTVHPSIPRAVGIQPYCSSRFYRYVANRSFVSISDKTPENKKSESRIVISVELFPADIGIIGIRQYAIIYVSAYRCSEQSARYYRFLLVTIHKISFIIKITYYYRRSVNHKIKVADIGSYRNVG